MSDDAAATLVSEDLASQELASLARIWRGKAPRDADGGVAYARMIEELRGFLNQVAGARPDPETSRELARTLATWSERLAPLAVPEAEQPYARRHDLPGRGQTLLPPQYRVVHEAGRVEARVTFGRYFLGINGAVHGGAIMSTFDDLTGRVANGGGRSPARTAYLTVNFRAIAPIEAELTARVWIEREEGRKRFVRGQLLHGETLCADCEGLYVALNPGQS